MRKEEFLNQLEFLLQDIPEEEKRDALDYYRDYLEEAGPEREMEILEEFGSPERVASIIRTDLLGGMEQGGEFTENGYRDQRFDQNAYPAVRPEAGGAQDRGGRGKGRQDGDRRQGNTHYHDEGESDTGGRTERTPRGKRGGNWLKYLLIVVLVCLVSPILFAAGIGCLAGLIAVFAVLFSILLTLGILIFCGFGVGAFLIVAGIAWTAADIWTGIACVGVGFIGIGCGLLLFLLAYLLLGKFVPWAFRGIVNLLSGLLNRNTGRRPGRARPED